jgi:hypothetical protein
MVFSEASCGDFPTKDGCYSKVALLMSQHQEYGILRKFGELNFKNLLYLQAELVELELQLQQLAEADNHSNDLARSCFGRHWGLLSDSLDDGHGKQWKKMLQIRQKLKEYSMTAIFESLLPSESCIRSAEMWR